MLIKTNNRWDACHALINTLLKSKIVYCNECGETVMDGAGQCCENPHLGTNEQFIKLIIEQNKITRMTRSNEFAETKDKSMRWGMSMPPRFFKDLCKAFKLTYAEDLFRDEKDMNAFLRKFPQFRTCDRV